MSHYIRAYTGGIPPKGWAIVNVPGEETLVITEPLATEIATLVGRGKVKEAQTLLFWFDTDGVVSDKKEGEDETSFGSQVRRTVKARADLLRVVLEQANLSITHGNNAQHFIQHAIDHGGTLEGVTTALMVARHHITNALDLLAKIEEAKR